MTASLLAMAGVPLVRQLPAGAGTLRLLLDGSAHTTDAPAWIASMAQRYASLSAASPAGTMAVIAYDTDARVPLYMPPARMPPLSAETAAHLVCPAPWSLLILDDVPAARDAPCRVRLRHTLKQRLNRTWLAAFCADNDNATRLPALIDALVDDALPDTPGGYVRHLLYPTGERLVENRDPGAAGPALAKLLRYAAAVAASSGKKGSEQVVLDDDQAQPDLLLRLLVAYEASARRALLLYDKLWVNVVAGSVALVNVADLYHALKQTLRRELPALTTAAVPTLCLLGCWAGPSRPLAEALWRALGILLYGSAVSDDAQNVGLTLPAPPHYARAAMGGCLPRDVEHGARCFVSVRDQHGGMQVHIEGMLILLRLAYQLAVTRGDTSEHATSWPLFTLLASARGMPAPATWPARLALLEATMLNASACDWLGLGLEKMAGAAQVIQSWPGDPVQGRQRITLDAASVPQRVMMRDAPWVLLPLEDDDVLLSPYLTWIPWRRHQQ
jgi:hypothetical protein